jgi:prepilin-type processing-associated H-X9-DG protein
MGSTGPQCSPGNCNYDPFQIYCDPSNNNLGNWGYIASPEHGNSINPNEIRGLFNRLGVFLKISNVPDGLSNTLMLGECTIGQNDQLRFNDGWYGFNSGNNIASTIIPINYPTDPNNTGWNGTCTTDPTTNIWNWNLSLGFKSKHSGGANFCFGDGSVHFINQNIDPKTFNLLGCRNDGQPVALP